jgi:hypothetical protein
MASRSADAHVAEPLVFGFRGLGAHAAEPRREAWHPASGLGGCPEALALL